MNVNSLSFSLFPRSGNQIIGTLLLASLACSSPDTKASREKPSPKQSLNDSKVDDNSHRKKAETRMDESSNDSGASIPGNETVPNVDSESDKQPPTKKFRKGDRALRGLIASEVPLYNKAQGDPIEGSFSLEQAFAGDPKLLDKKNGKLIAKFETSLGNFTCELFEEQTPISVANFVGLARGTRPYLDKKTDTWKTGNFYDGVIFHRVIEGFMLQTGDPTGSGQGSPGYFIVDEFSDKLKHDQPGLLSMANRNPIDRATQKLKIDKNSGETIGNTGSSQFFITVAAANYLDDRHSIFGKCNPKIPTKISKVKVQNLPMQGIDHRPFEKVTIKTIQIERSK